MKIPFKKIVTAVVSCQKLLTADKNENQTKELKLGTVIRFRGYMKIPLNFFVTAVNSSQNLSTAVDS